MSFNTAPVIKRAEWYLQITGLVDRPVTLGWKELIALPTTKLSMDFHCVTQWSKLDMLWEGVKVQELIDRAGLSPKARYVMVHCYDGYTTNLDLEILMNSECLLAHSLEGEVLKTEHGGPVRLLVPERYGWKSAKWIKRVEVMEEDIPGFWESYGYHMRGNPWNEERFELAD